LRRITARCLDKPGRADAPVIGETPAWLGLIAQSLPLTDTGETTSAISTRVISMFKQTEQTLSERLLRLSGQVPALDPAISGALCAAIRDGAQNEAQDVQMPSGTPTCSVIGAEFGDDREAFLSQCHARLMDVRVDAGGQFLCASTRTLWDFWRLRGQQLQAGFFAVQGAECRRLQALVDAHEQRIAHVDARCRKLVETLTQVQGA